MILTEKQKTDFEAAAIPMIKFLAENFYPHVKVIIESDSAEILESSAKIIDNNFIVD